jgi:hypothetical protein
MALQTDVKEILSADGFKRNGITKKLSAVDKNGDVIAIP